MGGDEEAVVIDNVTENLPEGASAFLNSYKQAKRATAESLMSAIAANAHITIVEKTQIAPGSKGSPQLQLGQFDTQQLLFSALFRDCR